MFLDLTESVKRSYMDENLFIESCLELEEQWSELTEKAMKMEHYCYVQSNNGNRSEAMNLYSEGVAEWGEKIKEWFYTMWDKIRELIDECSKWLFEHFSKAARLGKALKAINENTAYNVKDVKVMLTNAEFTLINGGGGKTVDEVLNSFNSTIFDAYDNIDDEGIVKKTQDKYNNLKKDISSKKAVSSLFGLNNEDNKDNGKIKTDLQYAVIKKAVDHMFTIKNKTNDLKTAKSKANKAIKRAIKACDSKNADDKKRIKNYKKLISLNNKLLALNIKALKAVNKVEASLVTKYIKAIKAANAGKDREGAYDRSARTVEYDNESVLNLFE